MDDTETTNKSSSVITDFSGHTEHAGPQATLAVSGDSPDGHSPGGTWGVGGATAIRWLEAREATKHLRCTKQLPTQRSTRPEMSAVAEKPRLTHGKHEPENPEQVKGPLMPGFVLHVSCRYLATG